MTSVIFKPMTPGALGETLRSSIRFRRFAHGVSVALLALAAVLAVGAAAVWRLSSLPPSWWREANSDAERASVVENGAWTALTAPRDATPWTVSVSGADASAWLTEKLPGHLVAQRSGVNVPASLREVQARFVGGRVHAALRLADARGGSRWMSVELVPRVTDEGLFISARRVGVGRLTFPAGVVLDRGGTPAALRDLPGGADLAAALRGERPLTASPVVTLPDGRRVRLLEVRVDNDRLALTCITEPPTR